MPALQVSVPADTVVLGKDLDYPSFGWDNEYGRKAIDVQAFRCVHAPIANGGCGCTTVRCRGGAQRPAVGRKPGRARALERMAAGAACTPSLQEP